MKKCFQSKRIILMFTFIISSLIFGGIGVVIATNTYEAKSVIYTKDGNTKTVQEVIEDLYDKSVNYCPEGKKCLNDNQYNDLQNTYLNECPSGKSCESLNNINISGGIIYLRGGNNLPDNVSTYFNETSENLLGIAYLDPSNLSNSCYASKSTITGSGTTNGCMRWFIYSIETIGNKKNYTMILDHNVVAESYYNKDGTTVMGTRSASAMGKSINEMGYDLEQLKNTWSTSIGSSNIRLITEPEIRTITGLAQSAYFFNGASSLMDCNMDQGKNPYKWLFDRAGSCIYQGCDYSDNTNQGYWTSNVANNGRIWAVMYDGKITDAYSAGWESFGLRPVITISK